MLIIMIRTVILYTVIILMMRLMGKKQLGELQPSELVTTILISNIATLSIEDPTIPMLIGIVPILMIVCIDVLMSAVMLKSPKFRCMVTGSPKIIISDGVIDRVELSRLRYTIDDVLEAMREQSIFDITEVRYAIVETTGKINFFRKSDGATDPPCVVIKDGMVEQSGITMSGMTAAELKALLDENSVKPEDVFLLTVSRDGRYDLIRKDAGK
ncbi:MAG: DUF421 domain-containing protein [Ruminiclostridium sp.]|nr:DUF421 domain-containing protein [Ruminiclostridium sp.]